MPHGPQAQMPGHPQASCKALKQRRVWLRVAQGWEVVTVGRGTEPAKKHQLLDLQPQSSYEALQVFCCFPQLRLPALEPEERPRGDVRATGTFGVERRVQRDKDTRPGEKFTRELPQAADGVPTVRAIQHLAAASWVAEAVPGIPQHPRAGAQGELPGSAVVSRELHQVND